MWNNWIYRPFGGQGCIVKGTRRTSCKLLGVNPFNQPGVESYKKNMFALLGKPGYENLTAELEAKLK